MMTWSAAVTRGDIPSVARDVHALHVDKFAHCILLVHTVSWSHPI